MTQYSDINSFAYQYPKRVNYEILSDSRVKCIVDNSYYIREAWGG